MIKLKIFLILFLQTIFVGSLFSQQQILLSKDYNSSTQITYTQQEEYFIAEILYGNSNPILNPQYARNLVPEFSFFSFDLNESGRFLLDIFFRDSIRGGIKFIYKRK
jgi:hypothetical protein